MDKKSLDRHLAALKFNKLEYGAWCKSRKFNSKINNKTKEDFAKELSIRSAELKRQEPVFNEEKYKQETLKVKLKEISSLLYKKENPKDQAELFEFLEKVVKVVGSVDFLHSKEINTTVWLANCWLYREFWVKEVDSFDCVYSNVNKIVHNLSHHLFSKYPTPFFWFKALCENPQTALWAIQITQGKSVKDLTNFSYKLSNKEMSALTNFDHGKYTGSFKEDFHRKLFFCWANDLVIADVASQSVLSEGQVLVVHKDFWEQFFSLFKNQMFNSQELRGLIDFLYQQKCSPIPEDANFSLKNRSLTNLLRLSNEWHLKHKTEKLTETLKKTFDKKFENWHLDLSSPQETQKWMIGQIYTEKDLYLEGEAMHHCVYSYMSSCVSGSCQIFSMRLNSERMVTIELRNRQIVQARKKRNKLITEEEQLILEEWAKINKLSIVRF